MEVNMEIRVTVPKGTRNTKQRLEIDENKFIEDLKLFVDEMENRDSFNEEMYNKLLSYGINKNEFEKMIERLKVYSSYDDVDKGTVGFPLENWIPKLLEYYS